jgi:hypothetical protein
MSIRQVFLVLFAVQLVSIGMFHTTDPDMWWHLRTGQLIWEEGIPRHDPFSFTVAGGDWITHEWLSEVLMWMLYAAGGFPLAILGFACLSGLAFWLVYRCSAGQPYVAALPTVLGVFAAAPSFGIRPQVLNLLFMATFVYVVERIRGGMLDKSRLWLLPLATVVWVNFHSGYLLGVVLLAVYAAGEAIDALIERGEIGELPRRLAFAAAGCLAAALFNPSGWHIWLYPFDTLGSDLMQQNIIEWSSPNFHQSMYWPFAAMLGLGVLSFILSPTRPPATDILLFLGTGFAGLTSRRHIALFAVATIPVIARALTEALRGTAAFPILAAPRDDEVTSAKARLNLIILMVGVLSTVGWRISTLAQNDAVVAKAFPVAAVDHLEQSGLAKRRGFNSYPWGGYLVWRGVPVFIDGRADVYGDFLGEYLKTVKSTKDWREPLDRFQVDYVLIEPESSLGTLLEASGAWRVDYTDDVARIFVRAAAGDR